MSRGKPSYVSHIQRHVLTNTIFATHILIISISCRIHPTSEAIQVKVVCSFLGGSFQCVEQIGSGPQEGLKGSRFTALLGSNGKGLETLTFLRLHNGNFWIILTWMLKIINWLWWKKKHVCHCVPNSDRVCNWLFACDLLHDQGWRLVIFPLICVSNCLLMNLIHKSNICSCASCNSQTVLPVPSSWKFFQALVYSLADKYNINYKIFPSSQQPCTQGCILLQKVPWLWDLGLLLIEKCFVKKKKKLSLSTYDLIFHYGLMLEH